MAPASILILTLILSSLHPSSGQVSVRSSPSVPDPVLTLSPQPTLPSSRPSGWGDVSVRVTSRDWPTERGVGGVTGAPTTRTRMTGLSRHFPPSQTFNVGSAQSQPTSVQIKTGLLTPESSAVGSASGPKPLPPTKPSEAEPVTSGLRESDGLIQPGDMDDWQTTGSGSELIPAVLAVVEEESPVALTTSGGMPQLRPEAQTAYGEEPSKMDKALVDPTVSLSVQPHLSALTPASRTLSTQSPEIKWTVVPVVQEVETANTTKATDGPIAGQNSTVKSPSPRSATPISSNQQPQSAAPRGPVTNSTNQQTSATTQGSATTATTTELRGTLSSTTKQLRKATEPGSTASVTRQSTKTEPTPVHTTPSLQIARGRYVPKNDTHSPQRNHSAPVGRPRLPPSTVSSTPSPLPSALPLPNGTSLLWDDLSRTLAFSWELHVYGSAGLFLLLMTGAALGLALSPSMHCPHRGALALANGLLFLGGAARAALFLVDPYGTRKVIPRPVVTALYNLPLPLLVWAQGAMALLSIKGAGLSLLPSALERPALAAVLAVLQCTLLLAADLLSPALSPIVPLTLQCMSICWGLVLCLAYLGYVFPCLRNLPAQPPVPEEGRTVKAWPGGRRTRLVLARVLAVCALLGVLCCALHVYTSLWLYGLLGDWTRFSWTWWLTHFWARLLELAWAFSLLLLGSWVFWRPRGGRGRGDGGAGESRAAGDLPSPGQSSGSTNKHTCWAKIVQSLTGKTCGKSESNGVGGGGGGTGELPNNWAGQERSGADISKSLIRNQNCEALPSQVRSIKDSNRGRNQRGRSAERSGWDGSAGSLLRMQALGRPPQRSLSGSLEREKESRVSLYEFDLRPPSPIDLSRSIDEALHREHLLHGGSLFQPLCAPSPTPSPGSAGSQEGPWLRRNSDPQISDSSEEPSARTESSVPLGGSVLSSVPSRQVTAPPTPSHQGHRWAGDGGVSVPSSVSCPVSLRHSRASTGHLGDERGDDTRPFFTPDSERGRAGRNGAGRKSYLEVSRQDDSASVSSDIIDL
ncbi:proline-rich transmembrane protein 3 [Esox lucius]|uniref:Proline-rich transmembrane protein 3/4 domain-containing protein n=1 Tax=Esox lucius TaxID=8010 RepID=A0A3P8Z998_ESOLU|nr:proline-rich transmembrane protein 3 [Esox lucius]XP_010900386.4 proline-rich transmembrane protein 3 [Esox lucius]XP_012987854.3 proline-rich transmembrane protein 3 [Esox lucius]